MCTSVQRLIVDRAAIDDLAGLLAKRVAQLRAGDPRDPDVEVGPLIAPAEAERAQGWIRQAVAAARRCWPAANATGRCWRPRCCATRPATAGS